MTPDRKIRTTIITGFLGAGKTTLINHLLRKFPETRFALVENEFGEASIDSRLIRGVDATRLFELKNGCICCTITDEYELILQELAEKFPDVEELLIESTGLAEPGPLLLPFTKNPDIRLQYDLRGIVCIADADMMDMDGIHALVRMQIAASDAVILSRTENLSGDRIMNITGRIKKINPFANIFLSTKNGTTFEPGDFWQNKPALLPMTSGRFLINSSITSKTIYIQNPADRKIFETWLDYLLGIYNNRIYRVKGLVYFRDEPFEYIVQGVGNAWEISEGDLVLSPQPGILVFIGNLDGITFNWPED